jgi:hypothetical protein
MRYLIALFVFAMACDAAPVEATHETVRHGFQILPCAVYDIEGAEREAVVFPAPENAVITASLCDIHGRCRSVQWERWDMLAVVDCVEGDSVDVAWVRP